MSAAAVQTGARERDAFVSMLARLDAQLDLDLAAAEGGRTDFVPTLQTLKPDEIDALTAAPHRDATPARARPRSALSTRTVARLLPWLVGGGLVAGAASFAMSFSASGPVIPKVPEVATIVPVAPVVSTAAPASAAVVAPAASAVAVVAAASAPTVVPAPAATVALLQPPTAAVATDSCLPARRALGLCELPTP